MALLLKHIVRFVACTACSSHFGTRFTPTLYTPYHANQFPVLGNKFILPSFVTIIPRLHCTWSTALQQRYHRLLTTTRL